MSNSVNIGTALPRLKITRDPILARPAFLAPGMLKPDALALNVMTDFRQVTPITVDGGISIDQALQHMIHSGVRLLFVTGRDARLIGLITADDIQGEKPLRYLQAIECKDRSCSRRDVLARNIMTPVADWEVLDYEAVRRASIAQVVATFKATGCRHLVVVERPPEPGRCIVRGLFSASRLGRELGLGVDVLCMAKSFADIERVLAHPHGECD